MRPQRRQPEGVVGLGGGIVDVRGELLELGEGAAARQGARPDPGPLVEGEQPHPVAGLQGAEGQQHGGLQHAVDARQAADRLAHLPAGVDRQDDVVVALGLELTRQQGAVPGGLLPVDHPLVHARLVVGQGMELRGAAAVDGPMDVSKAVLAGALARERDLVIAKLRLMGVDILHAPVERLGPALLARYVALKQTAAL